MEKTNVGRQDAWDRQRGGSGGRFLRRDLVKSLEPKVEDEKTGRASGSSRSP